MLKKKSKKIVTLKDLSEKDLDKRYAELKQEHQELRFRLTTGGIPNVRRLRHIKKEVARILTIKREREIAIKAEG